MTLKTVNGARLGCSNIHEYTLKVNSTYTGYRLKYIISS